MDSSSTDDSRLRGALPVPDSCTAANDERGCSALINHLVGAGEIPSVRRRAAIFSMSVILAVRPEGANHQWRKIPPGELSIDPVADERLVRVIAWVGAS